MAILTHLFLNLVFIAIRCWTNALVFVLRASEFENISSTRLDDRKDIKSVKSAWTVLHSELKAHILIPLDRNNNVSKTNTHKFNG